MFKCALTDLEQYNGKRRWNLNNADWKTFSLFMEPYSFKNDNVCVLYKTFLGVINEDSENSIPEMKREFKFNKI